jgi:hypothetical protein
MNEKTITQMETAITTVWRFKKYQCIFLLITSSLFFSHKCGKAKKEITAY